VGLFTGPFVEKGRISGPFCFPSGVFRPLLATGLSGIKELPLEKSSSPSM